ncbi:hypothetical protein ACLPHZ_12360 [Alcaligenaceae bacterium Me47]|jgi:hypothetical protein
MKGYPYWKVGLGFILCPGIAGVIATLVGTYYQIIDPKISWLGVLGFFFWFFAGNSFFYYRY